MLGGSSTKVRKNALGERVDNLVVSACKLVCCFSFASTVIQELFHGRVMLSEILVMLKVIKDGRRLMRGAPKLGCQQFA